MLFAELGSPKISLRKYNKLIDKETICKLTYPHADDIFPAALSNTHRKTQLHHLQLRRAIAIITAVLKLGRWQISG